MRRRNLVLLDLAWDLLTPPLAELAALVAAFFALVLLGTRLHLLSHPVLWGAVALFSVLGLPVYVLGGLRVSEAPVEAYAALVRAPFYAVWKFALLLARVGRKRSSEKSEEWIRTARTPLAGSEKTTAAPAAEARPK